MSKTQERIKVGGALIVLAMSAALAVVSLASTAKATVELFNRSDYGNEGTLIQAPAGGPDAQTLQHVEPGLMSIVFADRRVAQEFYDEAAANGERVCLADLGPQRPEHKGQRWWLFTC